jgi:hypothetical protein
MFIKVVIGSSIVNFFGGITYNMYLVDNGIELMSSLLFFCQLLVTCIVIECLVQGQK